MSRARFATACTVAAAAALFLGAVRAGAEAGYAGSEDCLGCHEQHVGGVHARVTSEANARTPLQALGCEACHGPGEAHAEEGEGAVVGGLITFRASEPETVSSENAACRACHAKGSQLHWPGSAHESEDLACTTCHSVHRPASPRHQLNKATESELCRSCHLISHAQTFRNSHMPVREGAMSCSSCHNTHGSVAESLIRADTVNENCYSCHADKRGPFLWEHAPVSESCLNCHVAHGSTRRSMLRTDGPRLCQQCHVATLHPSIPRSASDHFVLSRSCLQCHSNIHGSNHPSGFVFSR